MTAAIACSTPAISSLRRVEKLCLLKLLIAVEQDSLCRVYSEAASALGYSIISARNVLFDLSPPFARDLEKIREIQARYPRIEILVTCASSSVDLAVQVMNMGAYDYLPKPISLEQVKVALNGVVAHLRSKTESRLRCQELKTSQGFGAIIGRTPEMEKLYRLISKASRSLHPILILGESGTGKEMVARAIHQSGPLRDKPFIPVDCGSLVSSLIESELFGYVKGAFTGAAQSKDGLLAIAQGGTVFLDEIGELAPDLQAKLLRVLQEKEIRPVGSTKSVPVNVRVLAATNRDLERAVAQGSFRLDLFYRLNVLSLRVPPLRERRQDIPLLATRFLEQHSRSFDRRYELSEETMQALIVHDWPGNVRELENCIERCCAMSSGPIIQSSDLPRFICGFPIPPTATEQTAELCR